MSEPDDTCRQMKALLTVLAAEAAIALVLFCAFVLPLLMEQGCR